MRHTIKMSQPDRRMAKKLVPARGQPVDDKSGAGGFLSGEIPSILNICAHCEPIARCLVSLVDSYAASLS